MSVSPCFKGKGGGDDDGRLLCIDDTHRLLSQSMREGGWKVTPWNRYSRRDRAGTAWPPQQKKDPHSKQAGAYTRSLSAQLELSLCPT